MPTYDISCENCGEYERMSTIAAKENPCDKCGGEVKQIYKPNQRTYAQDDIPGGLVIENLGKDPVTVYSHTERLNIMKQRGLQEFIRHAPEPGSSRSKWTTNWDVGPIGDARPMCMLSPEERLERRMETATRLGVTIEELDRISPVDDGPITYAEDDSDRTGGEFAERTIQNRFNLVGDSDDARNMIRILNDGN